MEKYCIMVKRKGFNYYTDYMDRYFENVAVKYGYHIVKNPKQADLSCVVFLDFPLSSSSEWGSKWMIFASDIFSKITDDQLLGLSKEVAESFKSESKIETFDNKVYHGFPFVWYFSKTHNAFNEPPFITEGKPILKINSFNSNFSSGQKFSITWRNNGGPSKGLALKFSYDLTENEIILEEPALAVANKDRNGVRVRWLPLEASQVQDGNSRVYVFELPDYLIQGGINEYSAKLFGKGKQNEAFLRDFSLLFTPRGSAKLLKSVKIEAFPMEYPSNKIIWTPKSP
ncbi:MAG: hypothetical protein FWF44_08710 [Defluviitaleaceae bacterium]|nr:hypothetical protein [Defluviitaleaceae bacterium]